MGRRRGAALPALPPTPSSPAPPRRNDVGISDGDAADDDDGGIENSGEMTRVELAPCGAREAGIENSGEIGGDEADIALLPRRDAGA